MPRIKLSEKVVSRLRAPTKSGKPILYWDFGNRQAIPGFGVLCSGKTSKRTYIAQCDMPPNGRTRRVTIDEPTLEKARAAATEILRDMRRGVDPKAAKRQTLTLRGALDAYLEARAHLLRPRTAAHYRTTAERHLADWLDRPLIEITRDMAEKRHRQIAKDVEAAHGKAAAESAMRFEGRAAKIAKSYPDAAARYRAAAKAAAKRVPASGHVAANNTARIVRMLWNFAADRDPALGPNPVRDRKLWFKVPRRERHVPADDLPKFYSAVMALPNPVQRDYLLTLLFTGLRRREAAGLRWTDIDLQKRTLRIPAAVAKAGRKLDLPLTDVLHDMAVARRALGDGVYVFPANSRSHHIEEPKAPLGLVAAACGVTVSAHDLRRTFLTVAESCDISPLALKCLVNHSVGGDITAGYVQMNVERLRQPAQAVANKMKALCGIVEPAGVTKLKGKK
jgi:integrase